MKLIISCFIILTFLFSGANAQESELFSRQHDALNLDRLENSVPASVKERIELDENISIDEGLAALVKRLRNEFEGVFQRGIKSAASVLAIAALCSMILAMYSAGNIGGLSNYIMVAGALAVTASCTGSLNSIIGMGQQAIEEIDMFSKVLLPSLSAAAAATGAPLAAATKYTATVFFANLIITVVKYLFFPMVYAYIAIVTADAALENSALGKISDFIKWIVSNGLKLTLTIFVAYLSVTGILASAGDSIGAKTAKFALSGAVPVVGTVIADAAETVIAGAVVIKNAIGVFGMLTILSICITPFLTLTVNYFLFKLSATVIAPMVENRFTRLVENIGNSFGIVLGMTASCALLMFLSVISSMHIIGAA